MTQIRSGKELSIYRAITNCLRSLLFKKEKTVEGYIRRLIQRRKTIVFIQVGGCDCGLNDPLSEFILQGKAKGLIIEPITEYLTKAKKKYKKIPGLVFSNCAIDVKKGKRSIYRIKKTPELPEWAYQVCSFSRKVLLSHKKEIPRIGRLIKKELVSTCPLVDLIKNAGLERVDLLLIDTEGYDFEVLKLFPFKLHLPKLIIFEHKHLSKNIKKSASKLLDSMNYAQVTLGSDVIGII